MFRGWWTGSAASICFFSSTLVPGHHSSPCSHADHVKMQVWSYPSTLNDFRLLSVKTTGLKTLPHLQDLAPVSTDIRSSVTRFTVYTTPMCWLPLLQNPLGFLLFTSVLTWPSLRILLGSNCTKIRTVYILQWTVPAPGYLKTFSDAFPFCLW